MDVVLGVLLVLVGITIGFSLGFVIGKTGRTRTDAVGKIVVTDDNVRLVLDMDLETLEQQSEVRFLIKRTEDEFAE